MARLFQAFIAEENPPQDAVSMDSAAALLRAISRVEKQ
jgi:hypothetical protein